jgi:hypothetical protein
MAKILSYICPFCEIEVAVGQPCPGCAKKKRRQTPKRKPWEQDKSADGLGLPDDDFDYDDFIAREFGKAAPHRQSGLRWYWWVLALVILIGMIAGVVRF